MWVVFVLVQYGATVLLQQKAYGNDIRQRVGRYVYLQVKARQKS